MPSRFSITPACNPTYMALDPEPQVLSSGVSASDVVIVTTSPKHLSKFVPAKLWNVIQS
jgi:hypothetical protein